jgi:hypothetical protein
LSTARDEAILNAGIILKITLRIKITPSEIAIKPAEDVIF